MGESSVRANISWSVRRSFENEVTRRCTHTYKHVYSNTSMHTYARTHTKNIHTHTLNTQKQYTHTSQTKQQCTQLTQFTVKPITPPVGLFFLQNRSPSQMHIRHYTFIIFQIILFIFSSLYLGVCWEGWVGPELYTYLLSSSHNAFLSRCVCLLVGAYMQAQLFFCFYCFSLLFSNHFGKWINICCSLANVMNKSSITFYLTLEMSLH